MYVCARLFVWVQVHRCMHTCLHVYLCMWNLEVHTELPHRLLSISLSLNRDSHRSWSSLILLCCQVIEPQGSFLLTLPPSTGITNIYVALKRNKTHLRKPSEGLVVFIGIGPWAHMFECLVTSWWNRLGGIRRYGLVGEGVSLGMGFEESQTRPCLTLSSCCLPIKM